MTSAPAENGAQPWIAALARRGLPDGGAVGRIDTHISVVLLTRRRVFKFKKAVRLPFLDYGSLAARRRMALREYWINGLFAPPLYLGLRPVLTAGDGAGWRLGARISPPMPDDLEAALAALANPGCAARIPGEPEEGAAVVDWAVEMRRFHDGDRWDRLAEEGGLSDALVDALGDVIVANHARAPVHRARPAAPALARSLAGVVRTLEEEGCGPWGKPEALAAHHRRLAAALDARAPRLEARRRHGFQRRCHGDMHLANICTLDGRPWPFDAIEFSDDIGIIDCAYDLAFPVMDLLARGHRVHAWRLMNRVLEAQGDVGALGFWPLFPALRATIRAMAEWGAGNADGACRYRALADALLAQGQGPSRPAPWIAIGGLSGSGKSALARALGPLLDPAPGALWLRSDGIRKRLFGRAPEERLPPEAYAPAAHRRTYRRLMARARAAARAGWPALLDATWLNPDSRAALVNQAARLGVRFLGFWLDAPADVLRARVAGRGRDASDADLAVLERQLAEYRGPPPGWHAVGADAPPTELAARVLAAIRSRG